MENEELLRWSPSRAARAEVPAAPAADTAALERVRALGLLGDPATLAQRTSEHLCQGGQASGGGAVPAGCTHTQWARAHAHGPVAGHSRPAPLDHPHPAVRRRPCLLQTRCAR